MTSAAIRYVLLASFVLLVLSLPSLAAVESININPLPFNATTGVSVVATIADQSIVSLEYRWFINGEEVFFESSSHLPGHLFRRGDVIEVEVTPVTYTGERLASIMTRPLEASNAPPAIISEPSDKFTEVGFRYQVTAADLDEDVLTFKLGDAPENMQIDASSGLIEWNVESIEDGAFPINIIVDDGHGGQSEQSFVLHIGG